MKELNRHSEFRIPNSTLRRIFSLLVAETFLATSILPAWAYPTDHLRPKVAAERVFAEVREAADGGNRQHWSQEKIITTIQALHELGEDLNYSTVEKKYPKLVGAAHTHFPPPGSWKAAITAAGLDYDEIQEARGGRKPFSREEELRREKERKRERGEVVSEIRMLWAQRVLPYTAWIHAHYPALYDKGKRSFGKWLLALEAAGVPPEFRKFEEGQSASSRRFSKSKSTIDAILKEFHKTGADLGIRNIMANHQALLIATLEFYPTWAAAVKKNTGLEIQFPSLPEVTHEWIEQVAAKGSKARDGGEEKGPQDDTVISARAPEPVGAYPHARWVGDRLYLSGIGPRKLGSKNVPGAKVDAEGKLIDYDIEAEMRSAMENVRLVLEESGSRWEDIFKVRVYLTERERDWATYNRVYAEYFPPGPNQPVRTTIEVKSLPQGGNTPIHFEIEVTAARARDGGDRTRFDRYVETAMAADGGRGLYSHEDILKLQRLVEEQEGVRFVILDELSDLRGVSWRERGSVVLLNAPLWLDKSFQERGHRKSEPFSDRLKEFSESQAGLSSEQAEEVRWTLKRLLDSSVYYSGRLPLPVIVTWEVERSEQGPAALSVKVFQLRLGGLKATHYDAIDWLRLREEDEESHGRSGRTLEKIRRDLSVSPQPVSLPGENEPIGIVTAFRAIGKNSARDGGEQGGAGQIRVQANRMRHLTIEANRLRMRGKFESAESMLHEAMRINPRLVEILFAMKSLAVLYRKRGKTEEAIRILQQATSKIREMRNSPNPFIKKQLDREAPRIYSELATAYLELGRLRLAIDVSSLGLEYSLDDESLLNIHANALLKDGQVDRAIEALQKAIRHSPLMGQNYFLLARALETKGETEEAKTAFAEGIRLRTEQARSLYREGNWEKALDTFRRLESDRPNLVVDGRPIQDLIRELRSKQSSLNPRGGNRGARDGGEKDWRVGEARERVLGLKNRAYEMIAPDLLVRIDPYLEDAAQRMEGGEVPLDLKVRGDASVVPLERYLEQKESGNWDVHRKIHPQPISLDRDLVPKRVLVIGDGEYYLELVEISSDETVTIRVTKGEWHGGIPESFSPPADSEPEGAGKLTQTEIDDIFLRYNREVARLNKMTLAGGTFVRVFDAEGGKVRKVPPSRVRMVLDPNGFVDVFVGKSVTPQSFVRQMLTPPLSDLDFMPQRLTQLFKELALQKGIDLAKDGGENLLDVAAPEPISLHLFELNALPDAAFRSP